MPQIGDSIGVFVFQGCRKTSILNTEEARGPIPAAQAEANYCRQLAGQAATPAQLEPNSGYATWGGAMSPSLAKIQPAALFFFLQKELFPMKALSSAGHRTVSEMAQRHGFSTDAVISMLESVIQGNGNMAQFNHHEFSGSGQWMSGGMTMVSDMFNNHLKGRVNSLCSELSQLLANQPDLLRTGSFQSQNQGNQQQYNHTGDQFSNTPTNPAANLFLPPAPGMSSDWWPADLRWPNSTGAQNGMRYAYFAQAHRLAVQSNGSVWVYDTQDHQIGGFSQQQSSGGSVSFSSQYGLVDLTRLPIMSVDGRPQGVSTGHSGNDAVGVGSSQVADQQHFLP